MNFFITSGPDVTPDSSNIQETLFPFFFFFCFSNEHIFFLNSKYDYLMVSESTSGVRFSEYKNIATHV